MLRSLYAKLSLALVVVLIAVGLIYAVVGLYTMRRHLDQVSQTFNRNLAQTLVTENNLVRGGQIDETALKDTFMYFMEINPSIEVYLLDSKGNILSYSAEPGQVVRSSVSLDPIKAFFKADQSYPVLGDDPRNLERQKAFSVAAIPSLQDTQSYLYVVLRGEAVDSVEQALADRYFVRLSTYAVAISLVFGLIAGLLLFWFMTRRVRRLADAMNQFHQSDFTHSINDDLAVQKQRDEIDQLQNTFALMSQRIVDQFQKLKDSDKERREMVTNISHDLRTPLASMNGYLETLKIKADSLPEKERQEYLNIALRYGQHLAILVDALFDLGKFDSVQVEPNLESFSIRDLIQDVIQKFQLRKEQKELRLVADIPTQVPLVLADIALIERVLDNIVVNAIEYTPAGGSISIQVRTTNGKVIVAIRDQGKGIAKEELPYVFDRFYRGDDVSEDATHAGLGLAIAKRILDLHGSTITVNSEPGQGTAFEFDLPVAS